MNNPRNAVTLVALCLLLFVGNAARAGFSNVYVFGDSFSDTGNLASLQLYDFLQEFPYDDGYSNGPRAVESLAGYLGLSAEPTLHLIGPTLGTNYAVAGARARGDDFIDLDEQIKRILLDYDVLDHGRSLPSDALYVLAIGGNDIRDARDAEDSETANAIIAEAVMGIEDAVETLLDKGAESILVVNVPDLGLTPETQIIAEQTGDEGLVRRTTKLSRTFNRRLARRIGKIERERKVDLVVFDLFEFFRFSMTDSDALRFSNTTDGCFSSVTLTFHPDCLDGEAFDSFIFFDEIHPTARTHERAGRALFSRVPEPPETAN